MSEAAVRPPEPTKPAGMPPISFNDVYERESAAMVRLAVLLIRSQEQAEEVVQDAFAQLFERWERIEQPGAYLRSSVVNGCRRVQRRQRQDKRAAARVPRELSTSFGTDDLADALAALPRRRRAALVLRYYEDLSEAEIAETLGVRPGTVKSLLHRGLEQLRKVVEL